MNPLTDLLQSLIGELYRTKGMYLWFKSSLFQTLPKKKKNIEFNDESYKRNKWFNKNCWLSNAINLKLEITLTYQRENFLWEIAFNYSLAY